MTFTARQQRLQAAGDTLHDQIVANFLDTGRLAVVKAPPGSGKTFMLLRVIGSLVENGWRVAIATQTNTQANDLVFQAASHPVLSKHKITRVGASNTSAPAGFPDSARWLTSFNGVPDAPGLTVSAAAKWASVQDCPGFDLFAVDEAWQMKWADMMRCSDVSSRFFMIGDPGQIPPVTSLDVSRWGTSQRPPHKAVPEVVLENFDEQALVGSLPSVRRLPKASVPYVKPFYDFDFEAFSEESDRRYSFESVLRKGVADAPPKDKTSRELATASANHDTQVHEALEKLRTFQPALVTVPTPQDGPPAIADVEIAQAVKRIVKGLLETETYFSLDGVSSPVLVEESDIGITSSHRAMNGLLGKVLGAQFPDIRIDTPERWQGLQKPFMIAVHPLSGAPEPSDFDLGTGRLCVMASRHQVGLIFVTRDHVFETIANTLPFATQPPGQADDAGRGRQAHLNLLNLLANEARVVSLG